MRRTMTLAAIVVLMTFAAAASAAEVEIKMLAMVVAGAAANIDEAKAVIHPGEAKQVFSAMFDKLPVRTAAK